MKKYVDGKDRKRLFIQNDCNTYRYSVCHQASDGARATMANA